MLPRYPWQLAKRWADSSYLFVAMAVLAVVAQATDLLTTWLCYHYFSCTEGNPLLRDAVTYAPLFTKGMLAKIFSVVLLSLIGLLLRRTYVRHWSIVSILPCCAAAAGFYWGAHNAILLVHLLLAMR